jgi:DNA-directed RNA polymerase subunit N (RpoN/RPB10)
MSCHTLCPSCGNSLSEVYTFVRLAKEGYYKSLGDQLTSIDVDRLVICPDITRPIGFILDAAGLNLMCCRMHMLAVTNFDQLYK